MEEEKKDRSRCGAIKPNGDPCRAPVSKEGSKCTNHRKGDVKDKPRCGSTKTKTGKPCRRIVKALDILCSTHNEKNKDILYCGGLARNGPCKNVVFVEGDRCKSHPISYEKKENITKICKECKIFKKFDKFPISTSGSNGVGRTCKECVSKIKKEFNYSRKTSGTQQCVSCREVKDVSFFGTDIRLLSGLKSSCKECINKASKESDYTRKTSGTQQCISCKEIKNVLLFGSNTRMLSGLKSSCKECSNKRRSEYNSELSGYISYLFRGIKRPIPISGITKQSVLNRYNAQNRICNRTGRKMTHTCTYNPDKKLHIIERQLDNLSIDRIDSLLEYTDDNTQLV